MTKGVKISIIVISFIFIFSLLLSIIIFNKSAGNFVEIIQDNKVLYTFDLNTTYDKTIKIECENGYNIIEIDKNQVRISESNCPDKVCMNTGNLRSGVPIVCLPHKLVIRYADED